MKAKILPISFVIVFLIIFFLFYKGLQNSNIYTPNLKIEKKIPIFEAKIFENNNKISSELIFEKDKFYLLNIWASWCLPCREEHSFLITLSGLHKIDIIGLNYKDKYENAKNFLEELNNPYDIILTDKDGTLAIEWGAYGVPESFLIYNNIIIKKIIGPLDKVSLRKIEKLIK